MPRIFILMVVSVQLKSSRGLWEFYNDQIEVIIL